jgi:hypothetical protein
MSIYFSDLSEETSLNVLKAFIDQEDLDVSKGVGGRSQRTKADMYHDIVAEYRKKSENSEAKVVVNPDPEPGLYLRIT